MYLHISETIKKTVEDRKIYNKLILERVAEYLEKYPDMRFHQALQNLGINEREQGDKFYEESETTYQKLNKKKSL